MSEFSFFGPPLMQLLPSLPPFNLFTDTSVINRENIGGRINREIDFPCDGTPVTVQISHLYTRADSDLNCGIFFYVQFS